MNHRAEIERLRHIEVNSRPEIAVRMCAILLATAAAYHYTGWPIVLIWFAAYLTIHIAYWWALATRPETPGNADIALVSILFLGVLTTFASLPIYLTTDDHVALYFSANAACICLVMYMLWRGDTVPLIIYGEIVLMALAVGAITATFVANADNPVHRAVMLGCGFAIWGYFVLTILTARVRVLLSAKAARRSAQARKMEAVGRLAGGVAHDFNNILTALQGSLELYREEPDPDERDRLVGQAHAASHRAAELVRNLLTYARNAPLQAERVPVARILERADQLSRALVPQGIRFSVRPLPTAAPVVVDEAQLMAAMVNLIGNSVDAMDGSGRIELSARAATLTAPRHMSDGATLPPGRYLALTVADNGHGIPQDILRRVTDPFYTTKPVDKGTGLGLSMVSGFAIQSGGGLTLESDETGTRAILFLPWPDNAGDAAGNKAAIPPQHTQQEGTDAAGRGQ